MPRSLVWKLTLMLAIVLATVMMISAIVILLATTNQIIVSPPGRGRADYMAVVEQYYIETGHLNGFAEYLEQESDPSLLPDFRGFTTADPDGVLHSNYQRGYEIGDELSEAKLAEGRPLEVDGEEVAIILERYDAIYLNSVQTLMLLLIIPSIVAFLK